MNPSLVTPLVRLVCLAAVLTLTACAASTPVAHTGLKPVAPTAGACHADKVQWAVGKSGDQATLGKVWRESGAGLMRPLLPNQAVTQEYKDDRINVYLDESNVVTRVSCG